MKSSTKNVPALSSFRKVPLTRLRLRHDPRDGVGDVDDLRESFEHGEQLQNIVVRAVPDADEFEIVTGHRRVRAAKALGWTHIEAKVVVVDDARAEQYGLEENLRRRALPDEATALARLYDLYKLAAPSERGGDRRSKGFKGGDQSRHRGAIETAAAKVAKVTGQSKRDVQRKVKIGKKGTLKVKAALAQKAITVNEAERLAALPAEAQDTGCAAVIERKDQRQAQRDPSLAATAAVGATASGDATAQAETAAGTSPAMVVVAMPTAAEVIAALAAADGLLLQVGEGATIARADRDTIVKIAELLLVHARALGVDEPTDPASAGRSALLSESPSPEMPEPPRTVAVAQHMLF